MKKCSKCKKQKHYKQFYLYRNSRGLWYRYAHCNDCRTKVRVISYKKKRKALGKIYISHAERRIRRGLAANERIGQSPKYKIWHSWKAGRLAIMDALGNICVRCGFSDKKGTSNRPCK